MIPAVAQLGYLGLRVSDLQAWERFSTDVLGLSVRRSAVDSALGLRLDERDFRIALSADDAEAVDHLGWELPDERAYDAMLTKLRDHGIAVSENSGSINAQRRYSRTAAFVDPCGIPTEIAFAPIVGVDEFLPSKPLAGFVAGGLGLGHVFLYVDDLAAATDFYCEILGFRISDYITWPEADIDAVFLRCNARHHSIAFATSTSATPRTLEHFMLETRSVDDVGRALDALIGTGEANLFSTLGRHSNDRMLSFYARTPSGFLVEYGCDALQVTDESQWPIKRYTNGHTWGHARVGPGPRLLPFAGKRRAVAQAGG